MRCPTPESAPLHIQKLAVGVPNLDAFDERVAQRREAGRGMQVWTRSMPKRAGEIVETGSLYWVVAGLLCVRQRVLEIAADTYADGSACTRIEVEPILIRVAPRPLRAFQGWRYLDPAKTPPDLDTADLGDADALPPAVFSALRELCLL